MKSRFARYSGLFVLVTAVATACGGDDHPQTTFSPKGPEARSIANLINPVFVVAAVVFVVVIGGAVFVGWKFRAKDDDDFFSEDEAPKQVHGAFKVEIGWTIVPALILIGVGIFTVAAIFNLSQPAPPGSVHIEVIGQQWWWEYRYDLDGDGEYDDITTANDLVIPEGEEVQLAITSRDVIHSFWIPALNGKKDAVPNRHSPLVLEADEQGRQQEFVGQCTEYCGLSHANMRATAISLPRDQFDQWASEQQEDAEALPDDSTETAAVGQQYFLGAQCAQCHVVDGVNDPNFDELTITNEDFGVAEPESEVRVPHEIKDPELQVSRAAPNLTHLMDRTTFAGGLFDLRRPTEECVALGIDWSDTEENLERCLNVPALKSWLRNPPEAKPMAADPVPGRTGGRGMPNLNLSENQIDQVVAYLKTLK